MNYEHGFVDGERFKYPLGKIVCVGRNYVEHAQELNNPIPTEPILFIKPSTAAVALSKEFAIPSNRGSCHYETEIAILIEQTLTDASAETCRQSIGGVGVAIDLTLRDQQNQLKKNGLPWEKAKAFDGSCPMSLFVRPHEVGDWNNLPISLSKNTTLCQNGNSGSMITPIVELIAYISQHFTLLAGDVVLTGTPSGVGELNDGDCLVVTLGDWLNISTRVVQSD